jgi:hypothetical protein
VEVIDMARDAIVDEVRRIRDRLAKAHDYDVHRIVRALQEEEARSGQKAERLPAKRIRRPRPSVG